MQHMHDKVITASRFVGGVQLSCQTTRTQLRSSLVVIDITLSAMPVPYGFGVGDFLALGVLVWKVYNDYAGAPEQFRNFSSEILALHIVTKMVEDQLCIPGPYRDNSETSGSASSRPPASRSFILALSAKDTEDLRILYDGLQVIGTELDVLLTKYKRLALNPTISFDRLKWGLEDLAGLRERIHANISLLTAFNASLAKCAPFPYLHGA